MKLHGQPHAPAALLAGKNFPLPIEQGAEWTPERVWAFWRRDKSLAPAVI